MPRTLASIDALYAQETDVVYIVLLTIDHPSLTIPFRVTNDTEEVESRGETFVPFPFEVTIPPVEKDQIPQVVLRIDNIDRSLVTMMRTAGTAPDVTMELVTSVDLDVVEGSWSFKWRSVVYNAQAIEGTLQFEDVLNAPFPVGRFTPAYFPALT